MKKFLATLLVLFTFVFGNVCLQASANGLDNQNFLTILRILEPLNIYSVDQSSKAVFEDFFAQKNRIYNQNNASTENVDVMNTKPSSIKLAPKKQNRQF